MTKDGVDAARSKACELLLAQRVDAKVKSGKVEGIEGRIHVTKVRGAAVQREAGVPGLLCGARPEHCLALHRAPR